MSLGDGLVCSLRHLLHQYAGMGGSLESQWSCDEIFVSIEKMASVLCELVEGRSVKKFSRGLFELLHSNPSTPTARSLFPYPGQKRDDSM